MTIRSGNASKAEELRNLMELTFRDTYEKFNTAENMANYIQEKFEIGIIEKELQNPDIQYFIVEIDEEIIGYSKLSKNQKVDSLENLKSAEIERIYVKPEYKGQNIGRKLIETNENWAKENGFEVIWLGVWENNPNAIAFYEKMGFKKFGNYIFMLGNDAQTDYVMKKIL